MKRLLTILALTLASASGSLALAQAKIMNPGEAVGQLVFLSVDDVQTNSEKFKSLTPLSIPVFAELPMDLSVVAGTITLKQQNLLSHVQLKSRARHTPNLDISSLEGGMSADLLKDFADGDWIRLLLGVDGSILIERSDEAAATVFYKSKKREPVTLKSDLSVTQIFAHAELGWRDADKVGSKAANYAELAKALNTPEHTVVRPGFAIPFYYYHQFIEQNPQIKAAIEQAVRDPLMDKVAKVDYREKKLQNIRDLMLAETAVIDPQLIEELIAKFNTHQSAGLPRKMKLRSSTNSEDLPNFNGAGLYDSISYKPSKDGKERKHEKKIESLKEALRGVWSSVWNLRAWDERNVFQIPHLDVMMGIQVNPSFEDEGVSGVVVSKNVIGDLSISGRAVYIEAQRGDEFSVANPIANIRPEKILVQVDAASPLNVDAYVIKIVERSNISDDGLSILPGDNMAPIMSDAEIKDLAFQVMKADGHFKPLLGLNTPDFSLDLEFKIDATDTGTRQVYLKQSRPYID